MHGATLRSATKQILKETRSDGTMGDLIITYNIKLPDHLTPEQENLVRQMQAQG